MKEIFFLNSEIGIMKEIFVPQKVKLVVKYLNDVRRYSSYLKIPLDIFCLPEINLKGKLTMQLGFFSIRTAWLFGWLE